MSTDLPTALSRWEALLAAARHKVRAVPEDGDAQLTALITEGLHASASFADALARLDRAVDAVEDELDAGWRGLSAAFEQAMSTAEQAGDPDEVRRLRWQRAGERRKADSLRQELGHAARKVSIEARADAARALHAEAAAAWIQPRSCGECGAPLEVGAVYETTDFRCGHCNKRTRIEPDSATRAYLADGCIDALAEERALDELVELEKARRTYTAWLHPLDEDYRAFEAVARRTWTQWTDALSPLHPGWDEARARREAAARLDDTLAPWRSDAARDRRDLLSRGARMLREGKQREVLDLAHAQPGGAGRLLDDLSVCLHEHEDRAAAWQCLALAHHTNRVAEDRDAWMRRRIGELDEALRTR